MKKQMIKIIMIFTIICAGLFITTKVEAASARISASSTSVYVGQPVTITATYTAASWNLCISGNGVSTMNLADVTSDAENATRSSSVSLNTSKVGTYTISLTGDVTDGTTGEDTMVNTSVTVTVKEKPVKKEPTKKEPEKTTTTKKPATTTKKPETTTTTTKKEPTTTKTTTSTANTVNKEQEKIPTTQEKEEIKKEDKKEEEKLPFGISELKLYAINEKGEKKEISISPKFNIKTYEYKCDIESDVTKIEIKKNANGYDKHLKVRGLENGIKEGENPIVLTLEKDNKKVEYKIIVNKKAEEKIEVVEKKPEVEKVEETPVVEEKIEQKEETEVSKFLKEHGKCVGVSAGLMIVEAIVIISIFKRKRI